MSGDQADEGGGGVLKASSGMIDAGFPFEGGGEGKGDLGLARGLAPSGLPCGHGEFFGRFSLECERVRFAVVWRERDGRNHLGQLRAELQYISP
jgi:hypothetical protein